MALEGGGKVKSKRDHSPTKPYERKKSLFNILTDTIKNVLSPSWLGGDEDDDTSAETYEATSETDSGERGSSSQTSSITESRFKTTGENSHLKPSKSPLAAGPAAGLWHQERQLSPSRPSRVQFIKSSPANSSTVLHKAQDQSVSARSPVKGPSQPSKNQAGSVTLTPTPHRKHLMSESGRLSPITSTRRPHQYLNYSNNERMLAEDRSSLSVSLSLENTSKRQKLRTAEIPRKGRLLQPPAHDKPAFNSSIFCSPQDSAHHSVVNYGKATYGSPSAYGRESPNSSLPVQRFPPTRKTVKAKPVQNSSGAVLSSSTSKILKTLDRLSDAKRARFFETRNESILSFTPTSYTKFSRHSGTDLPRRAVEHYSPVTTGMVNSNQAVSTPAQRSEPPAATASGRIQDEEHRIAGSSEDSDDDVQVIEAPEEVQRLDGVSGSSGLKQNTPILVSDGKLKNTKPVETYKQPSNRDVGKTVHFNSPLKMTQTSSTSCSQTPVKADGPFTPVSSGVIPPAWGSTVPRAKNVAMGSSSSVSGGDSLFSKFAAPSGSWECDSCMLQNKPDATKCVACETPKPGANQKGSSSSVSGGDSLFAKFAAPSGSWECDTCMLQNKPDATKCVACETPKPGAKQKESVVSALSGKPPLGSVGPKGGFVFGSTPASSSAASPFLAMSASDNKSSGGFNVGGMPSSTTSSCASTAGFQLGTAATGMKQSSGTGVQFGTTAAGMKQSSGTGVQFGTTATGMKQSSGTGVQFGTTTTEKDSSVTGGFQFGKVSGVKESTGVGGVQFGTAATEKESLVTGGFQFGKASGVQFGTAATEKDSLVTGGFQFGKASGVQFGTAATEKDSLVTGGFQFGKASGVQFGTSATEKTDSSVTGGFQFSKTASGVKDFSGKEGVQFGTTAAGMKDSSVTGGVQFGTTTTGMKDSSGWGGFQFGAPSSTSSSPAAHTLKQRLLGSATKDSAAGIVSGKQDTPSVSSASVSPPATGFQLASKASVDTSDQCVPKSSGMIFGSSANTSGFQFGSSSTSLRQTAKGDNDSSVPVVTTSPPSSVAGFSFTSAVGSAGTVSWSPVQSESVSLNNSAEKLISVDTTHPDSRKINPISGSAFAFGADKFSNNFPLGAFGGVNANNKNCVSSRSTKDNLTPSVLDSKLTPKVTFPGSDTSKSPFGAAQKSGLVSPNLTGFNSEISSNVFVSSSSNSTGFSFSAPVSASTTATTNLFTSVPKMSGSGDNSNCSSSVTKPLLNGEVGLFSSGQECLSKTSPQAAFNFGAPIVKSKNSPSTENAASSGALELLASCAESKSESQHYTSNGAGANHTEKVFPFDTASSDSIEPFKFTSPTAVVKNNNLHEPQCTKLEGFAKKSPEASVSESRTSGFGAVSPGGFNFSAQLNAASSQGEPAPQMTMFGTGLGSTSTGQFSFNVGAGSQGNAAAASPPPSVVAAPSTQGFSFSGRSQPSFSFGAKSSANSSTSLFQFSTSQSPETASAKSSSGAPQSGQRPAISTATSTGTGGQPAQTTVSIGTGSGENRKIRRAVRRIQRE